MGKSIPIENMVKWSEKWFSKTQCTIQCADSNSWTDEAFATVLLRLEYFQPGLAIHLAFKSGQTQGQWPMRLVNEVTRKHWNGRYSRRVCIKGHAWSLTTQQSSFELDKRDKIFIGEEVLAMSTKNRDHELVTQLSKI